MNIYTDFRKKSTGHLEINLSKQKARLPLWPRRWFAQTLVKALAPEPVHLVGFVELRLKLEIDEVRKQVHHVVPPLWAQDPTCKSRLFVKRGKAKHEKRKLRLAMRDGAFRVLAKQHDNMAWLIGYGQWDKTIPSTATHI